MNNNELTEEKDQPQHGSNTQVQNTVPASEDPSEHQEEPIPKEHQEDQQSEPDEMEHTAPGRSADHKEQPSDIMETPQAKTVTPTQLYDVMKILTDKVTQLSKEMLTQREEVKRLQHMNMHAGILAHADSIAKTTSAQLNRARQSRPLRPLNLESTVKREYTEHQHQTLPSKTPQSDRHTHISQPVLQNRYDMQDEIRQEEEQYKERQMTLHDVEKHGEQSIKDFYREENRHVVGGLSKIEDYEDEQIEREKEVQAHLREQMLNTYDDVRYYDTVTRAQRRQEYDRKRKQREEEQYWMRYYQREAELKQRQWESQQARQQLKHKSTQPNRSQQPIPTVQPHHTNSQHQTPVTHMDKNDDKMTQLLGMLVEAQSKQAESRAEQSRRTTEKDIKELSQHKLLKNKTNQVKWLINLNLLREQGEWSNNKYCRLLPRLWNTDAKVSTTHFFNSLTNTVQKNRVELDRAFIEQFATDGLVEVRNIITVDTQKPGETVKEFLEGIKFAMRSLTAWNPNSLPQESYVTQTLYSRITSENMLKMMAYEKRITKTHFVQLTQFDTLALTADEHDKISNKHQASVNKVSTQSYEQTDSSDMDSLTAYIYSISQETHVEDDVMEDMLLTIQARETLLSHNTQLSVNAVAHVKQIVKRPKHIRVEQQHEVTKKGAVCNGPLKHLCDNRHICPWYSIMGQCSLRSGVCKHKHEHRQDTPCTQAQSGRCVHGAYCKYRHPNDTYERPDSPFGCPALFDLFFSPPT